MNSQIWTTENKQKWFYYVRLYTCTCTNVHIKWCNSWNTITIFLEIWNNNWFPLYFAMLWDIDLIFDMWVYNDKLQIKCTFRSGPMIFGRVMALNQYFLNDCLSLLKFAHKKNIEMWSYGEIFSIGVPICTLNSSNQDTGHIYHGHL
jgi:hypothetical protein